MTDFARLAVEVEQYFVSPTWVAKKYDVSRLAVHRAIAARRLIGIRIRGGGRYEWILDTRTLPEEFPRDPSPRPWLNSSKPKTSST